jgi:hypothetical protein
LMGSSRPSWGWPSPPLTNSLRIPPTSCSCSAGVNACRFLRRHRIRGGSATPHPCGTAAAPRRGWRFLQPWPASPILRSKWTPFERRSRGFHGRTDLQIPASVTAVDRCRHFAPLAVQVIVVTGLGLAEEHASVRDARCAMIAMKALPPDPLCREVVRLVRSREDRAPRS